MRARLPDSAGYIERHGVSIHYEVYGDDGPTILLMPSWTIVHNRFWKGQIPYLSRHFRVVTYDGPGNGQSDRPVTPAAYRQQAQVDYALAVLDATNTTQAVLVALSRAANWALQLAVDHPARVLGSIFVGPSMALDPKSDDEEARLLGAPLPTVEKSVVPTLGTDPGRHWVKYNPSYWLDDYADFTWFFFGQCFTEPYSTKQIEDGVAWASETSPEVLVAELTAGHPSAATLTDWCTRLTSPLLLVHGSGDRVVSPRVSEHLAKLTNAELVVLADEGHIPMARNPVAVNLLIRDFAARFRSETSQPPATQTPVAAKPAKRVLYLSSPIGLGHAQRDLAIARALREQAPGVQIEWLTQHPVTRFLDDSGERVHRASRLLVNESAHIESEAGEHDLHCFQALRDMDEILISNFMVFHDLVTSERYDLVVGDEAWDVDHFLHENPRLKRFSYAWMTDFVGYLPFTDGGQREELVAADYNAEMINHIEQHPDIRDRAIFVGDPDDIVAQSFGRDLPMIRDWTEAHYDFTGYVTGFDTTALADRDALRRDLGYRPDERVCIVTVGGSGVGHDLLRRVVDAYPVAAAQVPGLRMVVVAGPRIDTSDLPVRAGLEIREYVPDLFRHLAACDLAVVQGGLSTCMELTATGRPFIYVPLRHHFEQNLHVAHRLERHRAGRRMDYGEITPESLAQAISEEIGKEVDYFPVSSDGAARAAKLLADLL